MGRLKMRSFGWFDAVEFLNNMMDEKPLVLLMVPLLLGLWAFEKWLFSLSTWLAFALAVWAPIQVISNTFFYLILNVIYGTSCPFFPNKLLLHCNSLFPKFLKGNDFSQPYSAVW